MKKTASLSPLLHFFILILSFTFVLAGCAGAQKKTAGAPATETTQPPSEPDVESSLAEAAARFQLPDAPAVLTLMDKTRVEYQTNGGFRVEVRMMWAARTQPSKPFPSPLQYNAGLQKLSGLELRSWDFNKDGRFEGGDDVACKPKTFLENAPLGLETLQTVELPELKAGKALEVRYTLENLPSPSPAEAAANSGMAHAAERAFSFRWQGEWPSLKRELILSRPVSLKLFGTKNRMPANVKTYEKTSSSKIETTWVLEGWQPGLDNELYQPPVNDLTGVTAFTTSPDWETALEPFRADCEKALVEVKDITWQPVDSEGNTLSVRNRDEEARNLINHLRAQWKFVDSGLPIFHQPRRPLQDALGSKTVTPREAALILAASLKIIGLQPKILLARRAPGGALLTQSPSLTQFDQILIGWESGKDFYWADPSEPLAAAGNLPLALLDVPALEAGKPVKWRNTPALLARDHRKERNVELEIRSDGSLACNVELTAYGSSEVALRQFFRATTDVQRRDIVSRGLSRRFPKAKLLDYKANDYRDLTQPLIVHYGFEVSDFAALDRQGRMTFFPPVFEDVEDFLSNLRDARRNPLVLPQNFNSTVRQIIRLPKGWTTKDLPETGTLSNPVAEFLAEPKIQFGTLIYERYTGIKKRTIAPGADYKQLLAFYQAVLKQDRTPFYLVRGSNPIGKPTVKAATHPARRAIKSNRNIKTQNK